MIMTNNAIMDSLPFKVYIRYSVGAKKCIVNNMIRVVSSGSLRITGKLIRRHGCKILRLRPQFFAS
jgi:hypothetical protein